MDSIRKNLDLKNISLLKKGELAVELANIIPTKFMQVIYTLDQERYSLVKEITKNSGMIDSKGISISKVESLMEHGIIFPGVYNNKKVLAIP